MAPICREGLLVDDILISSPASCEWPVHYHLPAKHLVGRVVPRPTTAPVSIGPSASVSPVPRPHASLRCILLHICASISFKESGLIFAHGPGGWEGPSVFLAFGQGLGLLQHMMECGKGRWACALVQG